VSAGTPEGESRSEELKNPALPDDPSAAPDPRAGRPQRNMFGSEGSGDTSGFGGLIRPLPSLASTARPFDDANETLYADLERAFPQLGDAIERVVVDRGELTLHVRREALLEVARSLRDDPATRFEMLTSVSGVDYLGVDPTGRRLHSVAHLLSMTHRRRMRLEVSVTVEDPHVPSLAPIYPTADWLEREAYDFFGIIYDGHPGLTRIMMPDDWEGHPQRKDYPLGGVPVEYKGAQVPPPDERRSYA
jgi:NADH-quinone oxidoreductase subunit C